MNNFGVIELASAKTTSAPGWAYVPDRQPHHLLAASATTTTTNRKRARTAAGGGAAATLSLADADARQEAKARREIELLDRDNARDVQIPIPAKRSGGGSGSSGSSRTSGKKHTPNVRKILQSQKTFANHLDDYTALLAQQEANPTSTSNNNNNTNNNAGNTPVTTSETTTTTTTTATRRLSHRPGAAYSSSSSSSSKRPTPSKKEERPEDIEMPDAPTSTSTSTNTNASTSESVAPRRSKILTPFTPLPPFHESDTNPLLASRLPPLPSDDELRALLSAPPLSYLEARAPWPGTDQATRQSSYPTRAFCAVCGYWGRVRCMKCGTRVCALDCLETHREECVTRYGL